MIKYFCDRCGKETTYANGYTIPPRMKNDNGIMHHGGFFICNECGNKWNEVKDRRSDLDFIDMSDEDIELLRYTFKVGDKVIAADGRTGIIVEICTCDRCKERGFYEPEVDFGDYTDYIMISDKEDGFRSYYSIGDRVFGNLDEESVNKELDECEKRQWQLFKQWSEIHKLKMIHQHKKKESTNDR